MAVLFKDRLRRWRKKRSQPAAAGLLGIPLATYRNWEQGRNIPSHLALPEIVKLMEANK